jgi:sulfate adenylyltransferase subunit 1 (EFTu-like GTPase family)
MFKTELFKEVKKDFKEFIRVSKAKETPTKALLEALIEKDIIKKKGTYFYNGEDLLGSSTDEVVSYLTDIKNQAVKLALQGKLKPKKTKSE